MPDRIDVLDASYDAVSIELEKTQQVIDFLERRAVKLREALEALDDVVNGKAETLDLESVTRVMDQLQQSARTATKAGGNKGTPPAAPESGGVVPPWLQKEKGEAKPAPK